MSNKVFEYYKELPSWAKGIVVIGGLGLAYITVKQIVDKIKEAARQKKQMEEITAVQNDLKSLENKGIKPKLSKSALEAMSAAIVDAVNGCGTDMGKIKAQFTKVTNDADVLALIQIFGLRKKIRCTFSDDPREDFWSDMTPPLSLTEHIQSDLSSSDVNSVNRILSDKGIKYQF
jgi:hypothetical protein